MTAGMAASPTTGEERSLAETMTHEIVAGELLRRAGGG
jgi:hypothetical protein